MSLRNFKKKKFQLFHNSKRDFYLFHNHNFQDRNCNRNNLYFTIIKIHNDFLLDLTTQNLSQIPRLYHSFFEFIISHLFFLHFSILLCCKSHFKVLKNLVPLATSLPLKLYQVNRNNARNARSTTTSPYFFSLIKQKTDEKL